ncbi:methionine aminopeptidase Map [Thermacetogenium phaeum DSM 12270]|jgi:methionyl aminopeptidase|uniref:Methionine aminopeptidase n=2 Tax=Thermacetogenium phaeum TaxID=85874 RepID=K4LIK8_THEPS|nr:type I methionyl aminopeptidase [Thermacetogenium phaeum]MDK2880492.1 methionyl aminopeptidase [Clostridia bacterium]MDN5364848.1 methionyl aminopeptidase [Thermacetogenium sp.]AFV12738.1 methionine aminopeptidase Map [Thermacetogenium phaeum DSM 12270]KUK37220.1 MAG: Methionine aminopeptidase [Thermacetogenium phaeum]MDN5375257.1 methionyl aminopeptidase [Thermacetogenium sp.]
MIILKSRQEIAYMRQAGRIVALTLQELGKRVRPGVTTGELNQFADDFIRRAGGVPAFLNYQGFPASICTSVNNEVVHGIPGLRRLENGDIISIDVGAFYQGYCGDSSYTFPVGEISEEARRLLEVTREALERGIAQAVPGNRIGDISFAIQSFVEGHGYQVVRDFVGHGIGKKMHEEPQVPNFGKPGHGPRLEPGMALAIEPMVNAGTYEVAVMPNHWTVVTKDGSLSAHFEHTVVVTEGQPEVLTRL